MYCLFRKEVNVKEFVQAEKAKYGVKKLCGVLKYSRSNFYYRKRSDDENFIENTKNINAKISSVYNSSRGLYGKRRMQAALKKEGIMLGLYQLNTRMKALGLVSKLRAKFKPKKSRQSVNQSTPASFLFGNGFNVAKRNIAYSTDITYIKTKCGWKYLCVFLDMCTRKIVSYSLRDKMDTNLVIAALEHAINKEHPPQDLIIHSDKGSQYTSKAFTEFCKKHGFTQSMAGKGACFDNAITETFNATIKKELVYQTNFETLDEAKLAIFEYIEIFYNRQRLHSSLGYLSPVEFETMVA